MPESPQEERRSGQWTLDSLRQHFETLLDERDRRYAEIAEAKEKALAAALAAAKEAVQKAENAAEKRFESVNEFRAQLNDQQRTFIPRSEVEVLNKGFSDRISAEVKGINERVASEVNAIKDRLAAVESQHSSALDQRAGAQAGWLKAVGVITLVIALMGAILMFTRK